MKKSFALFTIVVLLLSAVACSVQAQFASKGVTEFGGAVSYSSTTQVANGTTASESTSFFNFMPYANYYIMNGFFLGVSPGINIIKMAGSKESITNLLFFVVPGYTFSTKSEVFPFIEGMFGYTAVSQKASTAGAADLDLSGISYGGRGGIKVLVGKGGILSVGVSYTMYTLNPKGADKRSGYNSLAFTMGFSVFVQ